MPAPKNISHLSDEEQQKYLKERKRSRDYRCKKAGTDLTRPTAPRQNISELPEEARVDHRQKQFRDYRQRKSETITAEEIASVNARRRALPKDHPSRVYARKHSKTLWARIKADPEAAAAKKAAHKEWSAKPESKVLIAIASKKSRIKNSENIRKKAREYELNRRNTDLNYRLRDVLRSRMRTALKRYFEKKPGSAVRDLGCTLPQFIEHISSQFTDGMTLDNFGRSGWVLDHIIPLKLFDLNDREQFLRACHYTNIRPLWWSDNAHKSDKLLQPREVFRLQLGFEGYDVETQPCADNDQELDEAA
jgi:hypothetical protein